MERLLIWVGGLLLSFLGAMLLSLLGDETSAWLSWLIERMLRCSLRKLPAHLRERFAEEWRGHLNEVPGLIAKLVCAMEFVIAAYRMIGIATRSGAKRLTIQSVEVVVLGTPVSINSATSNDPFRVFVAPNGNQFAIHCVPVPEKDGIAQGTAIAFRPNLDSLMNTVSKLGLPESQLGTIKELATAGFLQEIGGSQPSVVRIFRRCELESAGIVSMNAGANLGEIRIR